jgi:hypothetical protein
VLVSTGPLFKFGVLEEIVGTVAYEEGTADSGVGEGCEEVGVGAACGTTGESRCIGAHELLVCQPDGGVCYLQRLSLRVDGHDEGLVISNGLGIGDGRRKLENKYIIGDSG